MSAQLTREEIEAAIKPYSRSTQKLINQQLYQFSLFLYNPQEEKPSIFPLRSNDVLNLTIEEDGTNWFVKGTALLKNDGNVIERAVSDYEVINSENLHYKFRNDGRDLLYVNIVPVTETVGETFIAKNFNPSDNLQLNYIFVVYDTEDIPDPSKPEQKNLKLYFWELEYQYFIETNANWSTAYTLTNTNKPLSQLKDTEKKIPTGDAIKGLIESVLGERGLFSVRFSPIWEKGLSTIFYTTPPGNHAIDDLNYLLKKHIGDGVDGQGDVPILFRNKITKEWILTSVSKLFSGAVDTTTGGPGPLYIENLFIYNANNESVINSKPSLIKRTPGTETLVEDPSISFYNTITKFQYVDTAAIDNFFMFVNTLCYSNDVKNKQFNLDYEDNSIESVKNYVKEYYVNNFIKKNQPNAVPEPLLTINQSKIDATNVNVVYSFGATKIDRYAEGRNSILKSVLTLNSCINFSLPGLMYRRPFTFVGIDRPNNIVDNTFDNKLLGEWFVYKVTHRFNLETYTNDILAVKMHAFKDIGVEDKVSAPFA